MNIAHVGHLGPNCGHDVQHEWIILQWLKDNLPELFEQWTKDVDLKYDYIDLRVDKRDFLKERHQYDVVCLYWIFNPKHKTRYDHLDKGTDCERSPLHSIQNWQDRLVQSGAKYLFTFGASSEISGKTLEQWYPYKIIGTDDDLYFTAYRRAE